MRLNEVQCLLLERLIGTVGAEVMHLPYTGAFEKIHQEVQAVGATTVDKHELWEMILALRGQSGVQKTELASVSQADSGTARGVSPPHLAEPAVAGRPSEKFPTSLFYDTPPATPNPSLPLTAEVEAKRARLLADISDSRLGTVEQRVAYVLQRFPETRESDTALCIRYWEKFQADVLEEWERVNLDVLHDLDKVVTIVRSRQNIQNDLGLFRGLEDTRQYRMMFEKDWREFLNARRSAIPEVRIYLDETGNEGDKAYTGVGGLCIINWKHYEMHEAALSKWRREQKWPEAIHFTDTGVDRLDRAIRLLGELEHRRGGVLFLGYAVSGRGSPRDKLFSLFSHLIIDVLKKLMEQGCVGEEPRSLKVIKEADQGFDAFYLEQFNKHLKELVGLEIPNKFIVQPIETVLKGREVLLECADLIAGGMQRRALFGGRNPKDRLAEAVINVTGFETNDGGALYRLYP